MVNQQFIGISDQEFERFQKLLHRVTGITLTSAKKHLVSMRLQSRLRTLGLPSYGAYFDLLQSNSRAGEMQVLVDLLTTNETYFFREPKHYAFLIEQILPHIQAGRPFRLWSAACSSGEEPYSLAMILADRLGERPWEILASDISSRVLEKAQAGVYPIDEAEKIPRAYLQRFCLKGVRSQVGTLLIAPSLRQRIRFMQVNLNDPLPSMGELDVIFLRNVMIYFDMDMKRRVVGNLVRQLRPGGHLIVGLAETLKGVTDQLTLKGPTAYQLPPG